MTALLLAALLLRAPGPIVLAGGIQGAPPGAEQAHPPESRPEPRGPAWVRDSLVYYHPCDEPKRPQFCAPGLTTTADASIASDPDGLFGSGLWTPKPLLIRGGLLSPHRPLTVSFWWRLRKDLPIDGGFELFTFQGMGIVSAFVRGKGEWCALKRPAGVLQIYYFQGIQNVNGIYDDDLAAHLDLRSGVWHHTAVVIRRASCVQLYMDGKMVCEATANGRDFSPADEVGSLLIGGGLVVDEILILNRAVDADQIADLYRGITRLRAYETLGGAADAKR